MITIQEIVAKIVKESPFLEDGLKKGIINYSAFARVYKDEIQQKLLKPIQIGAIVMALKRIALRARERQFAAHIFCTPPEIMVRSNLCEITIKRAPSLALMQVLGTLKNQREQYFLTLTEGVFETTIIASMDLRKEIVSKLGQNALISEIDNLAAITVRLPEGNVTTPGVYYVLFKQLAWHNINVIEMVSTAHEDSIILSENDADRAFGALKALFRAFKKE